MVRSEIYLNAILSVLKDSPLANGLNLEFEDSPIFERAEKLAAPNCSKSKLEYVSTIFHGLGESKKSKNWRLPNAPLSISENEFPKEKEKTESLGAFGVEYNKLPLSPIDRAETLLSLLQKYGSGISSGFHEQISLFDFAKIKSALSVCLHENSSEKLLLLGGSVSGVQTFLYDIISKNAAKNLKGRSFYLHLLADSAIFSLLKKLSLPRANIIYASGGSFFVLAPNTVDNQIAFRSWRKETLDWFFKYHNLKLFLETASVEFDAGRLLQNGLPVIFNELQVKLQEDKKHPFSAQLIENFNQIFQPHGDGGEAIRDAITGDELNKNYRKVFEEDSEGRPISFISNQTEDIRTLGNCLRKTKFWVTSLQPIECKNSISIEQTGIWQTLFENQPKEKLPEGSLIRQFNQFDFVTSDTATGFEFYGGNDQPYVELNNGKDEPKTFSELAGEPDTERSIYYKKDPPWQLLEFKRLGVLRMDVDGFGKIFQEGLPTLAHYSTLSRSLDWFFKGHLNHIWKNEAFQIEIQKDGEKFTYSSAFKDWTQILYAGGDDLFLIGRWDCLLDFSFKIQHAFSQYICENEKIGLSGGISLVTHKYPIMKAAKQAGEAEKKAKRHEKDGFFKKNSFTILGHPLHWPTEFEIVKSLKNRLVEARSLPHRPMPHSILMKIAAYYGQRKLQKKLKEPPSWKWRIAYDLTRARERAKGSPQVVALLDELTVSIFTDRYNFERDDEKASRAHEFFDLLMVAIRWAELEMRHLRSIRKN